MAKMIPPHFDEAKTGHGERQVFRALEQLPDDYVVFHSLGLTGHDYKVYAELDFVVVCRQGVLCLEVKGGMVRRSQGVWIYSRGNSCYKKTESPFQQVVGAANALRRKVMGKFGNHPVAKACYASGVMFPDISFRRDEPEVDLELVYDKDSGDVGEYIDRVFASQRRRLEQGHGFRPGKLEPASVALLADYFRGDFGFMPSLGAALKQAEQEIIRLTHRQLRFMQMVAANPRILLEGGAGTGKTLLCLEHARRQAEAGKRVLFVCFNHNLAFYIQARASNQQLLDIGIFHSLLEESLKQAGLLPSRPAENSAQAQYWGQDLPRAFCDNASKLDIQPYDCLVVDEGQDLLKPEYLVCLDQLVAGGLTRGNWLVAFDPNQNLYGIPVEEGLDLLEAAHPTRFSLADNCRNTRQVIEFAARSTGIAPLATLQVDGPEVEVERYQDPGQLRRRLDKLVGKLLQQGIQPGDICVLSPHRFVNSSLGGIDTLAGCPVQDVGRKPPEQWRQGAVRYCTLYQFKGLESPVVILIDVKALDDRRQRIGNYTAMTRAKSLLYVFCRA